MNEQINALLDSWKGDYTEMIKRWLSVPSLKAAPLPDAPFGSEVRRMLDMAMQDASDMGFATRIFEGYAGDVTLPAQDPQAEEIAVLAHLDVVPAGDGWNTDPFTPTQIGDRIYARGTGDDKGPALASLFAMKAIKTCGIPLKRSIKLILGCDEESGWEDMDYYTAHAKMPAIGFSPDATFPLINTEKGMLGVHAHAALAKEGLQVLELKTGERTNVIPGESVAVVAGGDEIVEKTRAYAEKTGLSYAAEKTEGGVRLTATGIPGHSAYPEGCRNAIGMMLLLLRELGVQGPLLTLANVYGMEHDGQSLGIACADEISGPLTCNMGILHVEGDQVKCTFDNRCPVNADLEKLKDTLIAHLPEFTIDHASTTAPHHVPADSELVTSLLAAYTEESGLTGAPESTGGGTYAKVLEQGVAFGAGFPDDEDLAHQANEYLILDKMILAAKIYANALLRLCAA
ncbi:MAG: Sapep family Mn(2+)-dependent dipeptidase [Clostridia bacterium]|nr:Sapep family Mn(2+)-dependent dipeptidase [Clostridia bacterium]